jgi:hypothetical protein
LNQSIHKAINAIKALNHTTVDKGSLSRQAAMGRALQKQADTFLTNLLKTAPYSTDQAASIMIIIQQALDCLKTTLSHS